MRTSEQAQRRNPAPHYSATDKFAACRRALATSIAPLVLPEPRIVGWTPDAARLVFIEASAAGYRLLKRDSVTGEVGEILSERQCLLAFADTDIMQAECWLDERGEFIYLRDAARVVRIALDGGELRIVREVPQKMPARGFALAMAAPDEAVLSPDGSKAVLVQEHNLVLREQRNTGPALALSNDGVHEYAYGTPLYFGLQIRADGSIARPVIASWSPDSRFVLSYRLDYRHTHRRSLVRTVPSADGLPAQEQLLCWPEVMTGQTEHVPLAELWLFDTLNGARYRIDGPRFEMYDADYAGNFFLRQLAWAEDSSALYFLPWSRGRKSVALYRTNLRDLKDGSVGRIDRIGSTQLLYREDSASLIDYMFCQEKFYLSAPSLPSPPQLPKLPQLFWISEQSGWAHLYVLDIAGEKNSLRQLTCGAWTVRAILHVDTAQQWLYFVAGGGEAGIDPYYRQLYRIKFDGGGLHRLTPEDADHEIRFAPDGSHFTDSFSRVDLPAQVVLRRADGSLLQQLGGADFSRAVAAGWQPPQAFSVKARDGVSDLYGILARPRDFDPQLSYPIVLAIYPGCHTFSVPKRLELGARQMFFMQALAELGFIVARVDGMGGPGRSKAFHDLCYQNLQDASLPDQMAAVRQLAQRHPYIDAERVGIFGSSAGGYATARALLAYPDFFKVGVALAGNHELLLEGAEWTEDYGGWPVDRQRLQLQSNSSLAARLRGRLLLVHGALDDNVSPAQSLRLAAALIKADKQVDMLIVPDADHAAFYLPQVQQHVWQYFDQHLK
ncbi:MAG: prolyl oligopeptidase family serine peptidase [Pseudomonadota bacterium]